MKITYTNFIKLLGTIKGSTPISIRAVTDAQINKEGKKLFGDVFKYSKVVGFTGVNYERAVRREGLRQKASKALLFKSEKPKYGKFIIPNKVLRDKDKFYLRVELTPGERERGAIQLLGYFDESGKQLNEDEVKTFLPRKKISQKQMDVGLSKEVSVRNYAFESIMEVKIGGNVYELIEG